MLRRYVSLFRAVREKRQPARLEVLAEVKLARPVRDREKRSGLDSGLEVGSWRATGHAVFCQILRQDLGRVLKDGVEGSQGMFAFSSRHEIEFLLNFFFLSHR